MFVKRKQNTTISNNSSNPNYRKKNELFASMNDAELTKNPSDVSYKNSARADGFVIEKQHEPNSTPNIASKLCRNWSKSTRPH